MKVKFEISANDNMKLVTEDDGTEVEMDLEMLKAFGMGTFMILVNEEQWVPRGFNAAAVSSIVIFVSDDIVCITNVLQQSYLCVFVV